MRSGQVYPTLARIGDSEWGAAVSFGSQSSTVLRLVHGREDTKHTLQELMACHGQSSAACGSDEKLNAEFFLQLFDGAREGRLVDMQALCRPTE